MLAVHVPGGKEPLYYIPTKLASKCISTKARGDTGLDSLRLKPQVQLHSYSNFKDSKLDIVA